MIEIISTGLGCWLLVAFATFPCQTNDLNRRAIDLGIDVPVGFLIKEFVRYLFFWPWLAFKS